MGSCKREVIDHVIVFNEDHLRRLLREYVTYYNVERFHTAIRDAPEARAIETRPSPGANLIGLLRVGGLHHRYTWQEAARSLRSSGAKGVRFFAGHNSITHRTPTLSWMAPSIRLTEPWQSW